jgi:hypothetical protein
MNSKIILLFIGIFVMVFPLQVFGDGACCDPPSGGCSIVFNNGDCIEGNGIYQGDDTTCNPNPCQQEPSAIPTVTEWGMIVFMALAGLGAVYYLRRHRKANN